MSRGAINKAIDPNRELVLYHDDYDFTRRHVESGTSLMLETSIKINDADGKEAISTQRQHYMSKLFTTPVEEEWRLLYRLRNAAYTNWRLATKERVPARFIMNYTVRIVAFAIFAVRHRNLGLYARIITATVSGIRGKLGETYKLPDAVYSTND
ncbi:hypothetical protein PLANTIT3_90187 [Plantibacter sp. T3]|nr:hypothetical protein PLANTIT3_90187 [Plantibacter sp. T3]